MSMENRGKVNIVAMHNVCSLAKDAPRLLSGLRSSTDFPAYANSRDATSFRAYINEAKPENVDASSSTSSISSCDGAKDSCRAPETVTSCERLAVAPKERKKESEQTERVRVVSVTRVTRAISQCCCPVLFAFTEPSSVIADLEELRVFDLRAAIICYSRGARARKREDKGEADIPQEIRSVTSREP